MKSLLGFKNKASQVVKERLDQAKTQVNPSGASTSFLRPFDEQLVRKKKTEKDSNLEAETSGSSETKAAKSSRSRSGSPNKPKHQETVASNGRGTVDPVLLHLLQNARSEAVRAEFLQQSPEDYTSTHRLKLLAGTYNVNGRLPPENLDLKPWLTASSRHADIVAVAFQEIVPLNAQNVVMGASLEAANTWDKLIDTALNGPSEEGHLIIRTQRKPPDVRSNSGSPEATSRSSQNDIPGKSPPTDEVDEELETDDLEGYLSPAEDTSSVFSDELASPKAYAQVAGKQMVGIYLSIWVRQSLAKHVRGAQVTSIGTGIMGYLGNKGAVAARMRVYDSGLTIIASHLSSGEQEGDELKRNYDYAEIVRRGAFPTDSPVLDHENLVSNVPQQQSATDGKMIGPSSAPGQWGGLKGFLDTEHVIWMGDLNYRLTMPDAEARTAIRAGRLSEVAEWDELVNMVRQKRAFQGWKEGPLTFPPTFKFRRGTSTYLGDDDDDSDMIPDLSGVSVTSTTPSVTSQSPNGQTAPKAEGVEKRRTPAWTDRILWRPHEGLEQLDYTSAPLYISDHKPVAALFTVSAKEFLRDKVDIAVDVARRAVDAREMASKPRCELEPLAVDAGLVQYAEERCVRLKLDNVGVARAVWQFMPLPGVMFGDADDQSSRPAPRWAQLSPSQGCLEPGEAVDILLRLWVDGGAESTAELLASAAGRKMDAILVLRIQDGNDIFCSLTGTYQPSFFGLPLTLLASLGRPLIPAADDEALESPSLRINTQKKFRQRDQNGSEGPPADFYSPVSSFHESPSSTVTTWLDADSGTARADFSRSLQRASNRSSLGSEMEFDHLRPSPEAGGGASAQQQPTAPLPKNTGLSSVEEVLEAFGTAHRLQTDGGEGSAPGDATSGQEAEKSSCSGIFRSDSVSVAKLLPPELVALTSFLCAEDRLKTTGLFVGSVDMAHAVSPRSPDVLQHQEEAAAVTRVRKSLDRGQGVPASSSAQDVAATILAFFCALPKPFMPHSAAQVCNVCTPSKPAAASLLADALSPVEWAIFRHMTGLMREALKPRNAEANGLTPDALAHLFAEVWFERMPLGLRASSHDLRPTDVADLQRLAEGVSETAERRSAFIVAFLDEDESSC